ncbi:META domain-containing protein [Hymenobacter volaticus]|uniref:META domain-containing protein n=1 Tax=Hymenobacter volaticus TaxID=2932254 RepID=A0ABY4GAS2_9BACT|nr:META domain-containing protein [Hymenobacter volaticus]UOQ67846.1 META domain-containing protein [Hymenobacter volaticus]
MLYMPRIVLGLPLLLLAACQSTSPASQPTTPLASLRNTRWVLRTLEGQPAPVPTDGEVYLLLRANELNVEGNGGCNRFRGTFELPADGQLRFGPLASTKMACPALATEAGFMNALTNTRTYKISGDTLRLFTEAATQPAAVLHAVYLH